MPNRPAFLLLGILIPFLGLAQPKDNSPITRYGLGDIFRGDFNQTGATGGLLAAWTDPYRVNPGNPASLPFLQTTAMEFGFYARYNRFQRNDASQAVWSGNLDYLSLAFPLQSRINQVLDKKESDWQYAMGVRVQPVSQVGYDIELTQDIEGIDTIRNIFTGEGGLTQAVWSGGVKYKELSFGLDLGYQFGRIKNNSQLDLIQEVAPYSTRSFSTLNVRGFTWKAGAIYRHFLDRESEDPDKIRNRRSLSFGLYGKAGTRLVTSADRLVERVNLPYSSSTLLARDTLVHTQGEKGHGTFPAQVGLGVTFRKGGRYQIGVNAEYTSWQDFTLEAKSDLGITYRNTIRLGAGGEWTPNVQSIRNYFDRVRYRGGLFYEQDARVIDGEEMAGYGLQIGFGFPVLLPRQQISFLDLAVELGQKGVTRVQQDTYVRIRLAATLNDNSWFYKRKYE